MCVRLEDGYAAEEVEHTRRLLCIDIHVQFHDPTQIGTNPLGWMHLRGSALAVKTKQMKLGR